MHSACRRAYLLAAKCVLHSANGILDLSHDVVDLTVSFQFDIAGDFTRDLLDGSLWPLRSTHVALLAMNMGLTLTSPEVHRSISTAIAF